MDDLSFQEFKKIPRLYREISITEKIDGCNSHIVVPNDDSPILAASRNRYIIPGKQTDNYGFAQFVHDNDKALRRLGPGRHYGEWWGCGINRGYNLVERRWTLFNKKELPEGLPTNIGMVPVLYNGAFRTELVDQFLDDLIKNGSRAAPGYMFPEGVVIYHKASGQLFKVTTPNDGNKGLA